MRVGIWKAEVLFLPHYSPFFAQWVEQLWKEASWLLSRGTHWWASLEEEGLAVLGQQRGPNAFCLSCPQLQTKGSEIQGPRDLPAQPFLQRFRGRP